VGFLKSRNVDTVVDVGANVGQFAHSLRSRDYKGTIVSFEPIRTEFEWLEKVAAADSSWRVHNLGLSDTQCNASMNVSEKSVFSSLHALKQAALDYDPMARVIRTEKITLKRLDDLIEQIGGNKLFLKIDVQGHERAVLEGAAGIFHKIVGVQLELPIAKLYEQTWNLSGALDYMDNLGFEPSQITPVNFQTTDPVSFVDIDVVFRRVNVDYK
jgi:FkbM family methyltransferase